MMRKISVLLIFTSISWGLNIRYQKTLVIEELVGCHNVYSSKIREHRNCLDIADCGQYCSDDLMCKRFMYDQEKHICLLYDSGENCITKETATLKVCFIQKSMCNETSCIGCALGYYGDRCQYIVKDCSDEFHRMEAYRKQIMSFIKPSEKGPVAEVKCMRNGRTVIQYRHHACKEVNFNRTWEEYVNGFGFPHSEYWIGLENLYSILNHSTRQISLRIYVGGYTNISYKVFYSNLTIGPEVENYKINVIKKFNDTEIDILMLDDFTIAGRSFSTYDRDNTSYDCPVRFGGGWWYLDHPNCSLTNLNGKISNENQEETIGWMNGIVHGTDVKVVSLALTYPPSK